MHRRFKFILYRNKNDHNLIEEVQKKLLENNKKLTDVKRKCLQATKQCLKVQLQNYIEFKLEPTASKESGIGVELGIIKSDVLREIAVLKSAFTDYDEKEHDSRKFRSVVTSPKPNHGCADLF